MARLTLEEGGAARSFRVGDGVLTIGSGEGARLRLTSEGVAEIHAELEVQGERCVLRPRPGVLPPKLAGADVTEEREVPTGASIVLGGAVLRVEADGASAPPPAPIELEAPAASAPATKSPAAKSPAAKSPAARSTSATSRSKSASRKKRARASAAARKSSTRDEGDGEEGGRRRSARREQGIPTGAKVALAMVGVAVVGFIFMKAMESAGKDTTDPRVRVNLASVALNEGNMTEAAEQLDKITTAELGGLPAGFRDQVRAIRDEIAASEEEQAGRMTHNQGNKYAQILKNYEEKWLRGEPKRKRIRYFLWRCAAFRERFPTHSELEWVERNEQFFSEIVSLNERPTWEELDYHIGRLTDEGQKPKDYGLAFQLLDEWISSDDASGEDRGLGEIRRLELVEQRQSHYDYQMFAQQDMREDYDREGSLKDLNDCVAVLTELVIYIGDSTMESSAAEEYVLVNRVMGSGTDAAGQVIMTPQMTPLSGLQQWDPWRFERITRNAHVSDYAREIGLL